MIFVIILIFMIMFMYKKEFVIWLAFIALFGFNAMAQDVITLNNGDEIEALVQKINKVDVEYKKWDFQDGPTFTVRKSEIFRIKYQNGTKDVFSNFTEAAEPQVEQPQVKQTDNVPRLFRHPAEPDMIFVEGGTFTMGDTDERGSKDERPIHRVTLSSFYIGKYEVTQEQWIAVMGSNPSYFKGGSLDIPVEWVSWNDIVGTSGSSMEINGITYYENGFIYKLNQLTGKQYRLPTEAEWE
jgi:formylglycine-generating enzyme required for sulfatase activity